METIKQKENEALSNFDIYNIIGKKIKIIKYPDIENYTSIFEIFGNSNMVIIFFETENLNIGHWECMFLKQKEIYFFDSYGLPPDQAEKYINSNTQIKLKENKPLLYPLFVNAQKSGYSSFYNAFKYQQMKGNISTCGRWCSIRLKYMNLTDEQFYNKINNLRIKWGFDNFDYVVTKLTLKY